MTDKENIFRKLKLKNDGEILILNAPKEFQTFLQGIVFDNIQHENKSGKYDFVQVFASSQSEMESLIRSVAKAGKTDCLFWACYPKSSGKEKFDLKRDTVWAALGLAGLRPVSQIAIDEKWSALRGRLPELIGK